MRDLGILCLVAALCIVLPARPARCTDLYSTSFETGKDRPEEWRVASGGGEWSKDGRNGGRCLALIGKGENTCEWRLLGVPFRPNQTYRMTCYVRGDAKAKGATISVGASFCEHDAKLGEAWEQQTMVFRTPAEIPKDACLYFLTRQLNGTAYCDDLRIEEVGIRHRTASNVTLSADEKIKDGTYTFETNFPGEFSNYARVEVDHTAIFHGHGYHHCYRKGQYVLYRFAVGDCVQLSATLRFGIGWYVDGQAVVEAGKDGKTWRELGKFSPRGQYSIDLPSDLFPTQAVFVRITATGTFEVMKYTYTAKLQNPPPDMGGSTTAFSGRYVSADNGVLRLDWSENRPELVSIRLGSEVIGNLSCAIAQFEKKGIGYKGTGIGSAWAQNVKTIALKKKDAAECIAEVTVDRSESAEMLRRFEAVYQFTLFAGQPWFESRLLSVKNTDTVAYTMVGYYHSLLPASLTATPVCRDLCAAWIGKESFIGALLRQPGDFALALRRSGSERCGDITRKAAAALAPGQTWTGSEPALILFAGQGGDKALAREADQVRKRIAQPSAASGRITYEEDEAK